MKLNVLPVVVQIGDKLQSQTTMKMSFEIDFDQFGKIESRISGDAMFQAMTDGDLPKFLRLLADKIEEEKRAGNVLSEGDDDDE